MVKLLHGLRDRLCPLGEEHFVVTKDLRLNSEVKISLEDFDQKNAHEFLFRFMEAK